MIVTEVKTVPAGTLDNKELFGYWDYSKWPPKFIEGLDTKIPKRLDAIKEITGETPEFIISVPKDVVKDSSKLNDFLALVRNKGYHAEVVELSATNEEFNAATDIINALARQRG